MKIYQQRINDISRRNRAIRLSIKIKIKTFDIAILSKVEKDKPIKLVIILIFEEYHGKQRISKTRSIKINTNI